MLQCVKEYFSKHNIPLPPYVGIPNIEAIYSAAESLGLPLMLKSRRGAYDGRGNTVLKETSRDAIATALSDLGLLKRSAGGYGVDIDHSLLALGNDDDNDDDTTLLYAEGWINFHSEVGVMVARSTTGEVRAYPTTTAIQTDSICRVVLVPARSIPANVRKKCEDIAMRAVNSLGEGATGMFGVELFLVLKDNGGGGRGRLDVLLNEVAPRPHNTGHYTQDACAVSQFENHLRGVCGLPLGSTELIVGAAASEYRI